MLHLYHVIPLIIIYVIKIPVGGHYDMNMFWTRIILLSMDHAYYWDQIENQILRYSLDRFYLFNRFILLYL